MLQQAQPALGAKPIEKGAKLWILRPHSLCVWIPECYVTPDHPREWVVPLLFKGVSAAERAIQSATACSPRHQRYNPTLTWSGYCCVQTHVERHAAGRTATAAELLHHDTSQSRTYVHTVGNLNRPDTHITLPLLTLALS